ncbi:MAG: AAA family ATPase [Acidobacteria bacterium]|nr:AAA family ATPase [Acidobacteriota bacterium]
MSVTPKLDELFDRRVDFPNPDAQGRLAMLAGIDDQKGRLKAQIDVCVQPKRLRDWFRWYHPNAHEALTLMLRRPPLVVLAGDVGCGKTALAENIGDAVSRDSGDFPITLYPLSLSSRGQGRVGEMTQLISGAFDIVLQEGRRLCEDDSGTRAGLILLIDEADALAQSREEAQMHHEDRAGVNALIRGIDRIADAKVPVAVIMCTNRLGALDPAIRRRAADILSFHRPDDSQRRDVLTRMTSGFALSDAEVDHLVKATGRIEGRTCGFTFSDITQRLLPAMVLDAYPGSAVNAKRAIAIAENTAPTAPFKEGIQ